MQKNKIRLFVIGILFIGLVKFFIRPFVQVPSIFFLCRDVAPNLISAFLIPFGADLFLKKWVPLKDKRNVFLVCSAGLIVITLNEIAQLFPIFKRTFDYFDLLFSLIGVGLGYYIFVQYFLTKTSKEPSN